MESKHVLIALAYLMLFFFGLVGLKTYEKAHLCECECTQTQTDGGEQ